MTTVILPLNNTATGFSNNYNGFYETYDIATFDINKSNTPLWGNLFEKNLVSSVSGNNIVIKPLPMDDPNPYWFVNTNGKYVPQKWIKADIFQAIDSNLRSNFIFQANFSNINLTTNYSKPYIIQVYIQAYDANYNRLGENTYFPGNNAGNFILTLDTTGPEFNTIAHLHWGFNIFGYPVYPLEAGNQGSVSINSFPCFKEDTKILTNNGYVPIQELRKGDLVKTLLNDYKPIVMIGKNEIYNIGSEERIADQLYVCSNDKYPEVFEDLVITGCHSILVDDFISEEQREKVIQVNGDTYVTNVKYRLPACCDEKAVVYDKKGTFTIYNFALEHDEDSENYGIYANGLLVETCSKKYLKDLSGVTLIE